MIALAIGMFLIGLVLGGLFVLKHNTEILMGAFKT
jgi:uncharacterized membrane protein (DUF485 family)